MVRRWPLVALVCAVAVGCSPLEETADGFRLTEGDTFVVPEGERWEVDALGLTSAAVGAVLLTVDGTTRITLHPARDGTKVEFAEPIPIDPGAHVAVLGGAAGDDAYCVLLPLAIEPRPRPVGTLTRASAAPTPMARELRPPTRVLQRATGAPARASAWTTTGLAYGDSRPSRVVLLWAIWDDGLVMCRVSPELDRGEYDVGRVRRDRIDELAAACAALSRPAADPQRVFPLSLHSETHVLAVVQSSEASSVAVSTQHWRRWVTTGRRPSACEGADADAVARLHADVFDAARHGVACELPELALDAVEWPAFDDFEPEIRPKR
jgi:hypothetical protein